MTLSVHGQVLLAARAFGDGSLFASMRALLSVSLGRGLLTRCGECARRTIAVRFDPSTECAEWRDAVALRVLNTLALLANAEEPVSGVVWRRVKQLTDAHAKVHFGRGRIACSRRRRTGQVRRAGALLFFI